MRLHMSLSTTQKQFEPPVVAKYMAFWLQERTDSKAHPLIVCSNGSQCLPCMYAGVPLFGLSRSAVPILHLANCSIHFKPVNFLWANFHRPAGMVNLSERLTWYQPAIGLNKQALNYAVIQCIVSVKRKSYLFH